MKKLTRIGLLALIILSFSQCTAPKKEENTSPETPAVVLPQLTEAQKAEGWQLLFDGQSLTGWQIFKDRENNTWEVSDGVIHCKALDETTTGVGDKRSDIMTSTEYGNFEFSFEWKIATQGNSGVMFRVAEELEQPYYTGPEYQLIDDAGFPDETPDHLTGANYGMHAPKNAKTKPAGDWNSSKLVVNKNHVEHWLNGDKVVEYELNSPEWIALKKAGKWKDAEKYGALEMGHIVLQDHGSEAWFRNIMIKELR